MSGSIHERDILPDADAEELIDFTCATPWERLALDIELELRAWGLHDGQVPSVSGYTVNGAPAAAALEPSPVAVATVCLANRPLSLQLRIAPADLSLDAHPLERLLGTNQCVLLAADSPDSIAADDGSDAAVLLSALTVAASACGCSLPMLVPVGRPNALRFIGRQIQPQHLRFSCDYANQLPEQYSHLAGLLNLFHNKRFAARRLSPPSIEDASISAKFTYDWSDFSFKLAPTPGSFAADRRLAAVQAGALSEADPIRRIRVTAIWDQFQADDVCANESLAGMPAATASRLRLAPTPDLVKALRSAQIPSLRLPLTTPARMNLRLAQDAASRRDSHLPSAPSRLVSMSSTSEMDPSMTSSPVDTTADRRANSGSSRSAPNAATAALDEFLVRAGEYIAAAALQDDKLDEEYLISSVAALFEMDLGRGIMVDVVEALGPNAAEMTVLERVSRLAAVSDSVNAASKLWGLFLDGLDMHWERNWIVGGVPFSADKGPDLDECLLVQKLQMVNCCVERRRHGGIGLPNGCHSALGRKSVMDGCSLIGDVDTNDAKHGAQVIEHRDVWEPYVQPLPLVTRDMVEEEQRRMLIRAESTLKKNEEEEARRQSQALRSDMMSFKAANPGASISDFVRWFSPSDWTDQEEFKSDEKGCTETRVSANADVELDVQRELPEEATPGRMVKVAKTRQPRSMGRLSARMSAPGNVWAELWGSADAVQATQQRPLFDAITSGKQALRDLRGMPMAQVLMQLSAVQATSAVSLLQQAFSKPPSLPFVQKAIETARHAVRRVCSVLPLSAQDEFSRSDASLRSAECLGMLAAASDTVAIAEHMALCATSVIAKLPPVDGFSGAADALASGAGFVIETEQERTLLTRMAGLDDGGWRAALLPEHREFVLNGQGHDRMYARLSGEEFRVAFRLGLDYSL